MEITVNFEFVNWWAVLAATVTVFVMGGIWYSPAAFGRFGEANRATERRGRNMQAIFIFAFLLQWSTASLLAAVLGPNATIAYEFTSLGPLGDNYLETYTAQWYEKFMQVWERQMNHYLETGEVSPDPDLQSG